MGSRRSFGWSGLAGIALSAVLWSSWPASAAVAAGPACGQRVVTSPTGVAIRILFAKNGAVQRYQVVAMGDNTELVNDARIALERTYGPASVNAPALRIISYRPSGSGGMSVPDKAIDSCGRTLTFN